jgi:hypothetical protein
MILSVRSPQEFYLTMSDFAPFQVIFLGIILFWLWSVSHLCAILREMKEHSIDSKRIARWIGETGLQDIVAFLLDVARPFGVFIAQTAYIIEPVIGGHHDLLRDFAALLEDPDHMQELMDQLDTEKEAHG